MLNEKMVDRARRLTETQLEERRKVFPKEISRIMREMHLENSLYSSTTVFKIHDICVQEVAKRTKIVWESILRAHKVVGSLLSETLAADIKQEIHRFIGDITKEVGGKMADKIRSIGGDAYSDNFYNLDEARNSEIQKMDIEIDLYVDSLAMEPKRAQSINVEGVHNMIKVFISHSSKDKELAQKVAELVKNALCLSANEIRCTTVDGYRLPGGAKTNEQLKQEIRDCTAFVGLISIAATDSMYVLFELGARWGSDKHLLPLLAPGIPVDILKGPISDYNALSCGNRSQLHQLIEELGDILKIKPEKPAAYQRYIDEILAISNVSPTEMEQIKLPQLRREDSLSAEAKQLLEEASKDAEGKLFKIRNMRKCHIATNKKAFGGNRGREFAKWEDALNQLMSKNYVKPLGDKGEVFEVTHAGYQLADKLNGKGDMLQETSEAQQQDGLEFEKISGTYLSKGDELRYCTKCWHSSSKKIPLREQENGWHCNVCGKFYPNPNYNPPPPRIV